MSKTRNPERFGRLQNRILENEHREQDEIAWLDEEGPTSPKLIHFIRKNLAAYDYFIFFSYRYYHSYWGIRAVPEKSILVPTAEHDPVIHLKIFKDLFRMPRAFIYNSEEEREMIQTLSGNQDVPGIVVGVGTEVPAETSAERFRQRHGLSGPYILYIGRIDENKGCPAALRLLPPVQEPKRDRRSSSSSSGISILKIPSHPDIRHLGFLPEQDKFDALSRRRGPDHALVL